MSRPPPGRVAALALALAASGGTAPALAGGDADNGRRFAHTHCQRCQVVSPENRYAGIDSTPSFMMLASRDDWRERFSTFFDRPPHPVFARVPGVPRRSSDPSPTAEIEATPEEIEDIMAFAATLRPE